MHDIDTDDQPPVSTSATPPTRRPARPGLRRPRLRLRRGLRAGSPSERPDEHPLGAVVHRYTRAQAVADGELVDVTYTARSATTPELPAVVIITGSGLDGRGLRHFARDRWVDALAHGRRPELFVAGEGLAVDSRPGVGTTIRAALPTPV